jgi:predicted lipoprotein with Yx(FWY)xxD motif
MATRKIFDLGSSRKARRMRLALPAAAVAGAAALAACGSSGTSGSASGGSSPAVSATAAAKVGVKTMSVGGTNVLTSSKGLTLYSFAIDTSTKSNCNGACAAQWPPVTPTTASGVKAPFATIKRADGATQLTFHGHPMYTFIGDKSAGQANGNGLNAFGGLWHEAPANGAPAPANTTGNGGGY